MFKTIHNAFLNLLIIGFLFMAAFPELSNNSPIENLLWVIFLEIVYFRLELTYYNKKDDDKPIDDQDGPDWSV